MKQETSFIYLIIKYYYVWLYRILGSYKFVFKNHYRNADEEVKKEMKCSQEK